MKNIIFFLIFGSLSIGGVCAAELYQWTDKNGTTHFSDKKPEAIQGAIHKKESVDNKPITTEGDNKYNTKMMQLTNAERLYIFSETVNSTNTGKGCVPVTATFQGIGWKNNAFWKVRCSNGKYYGVRLPPDGGYPGVVNCMELRLNGIVPPAGCLEE